jgi:predicted phosphodiesterase
MKNLKIIFLMAVLLVVSRPVHAQEFSFAVVSDIHRAQDSWLNALKELGVQKVDLILVAGDMAPDSDRYIDFENSFYMSEKTPVFLPVPGNHEFEDGIENFRYMRDKILPTVRGLVRRGPDTGDYYYDYGNTRFIAVDAYSELGAMGVINDAGRNWVESVIVSASEEIKNVFIFFHEPAYPQFRHIGDSFDENVQLRDAFWAMLGKHKNKVKGVFCGHTHHSYRNEYQGILQISPGTIGNGRYSSFVTAKIDGEKITFEKFQAENGADKRFILSDSWTAVNSLTTIP